MKTGIVKALALSGKGNKIFRSGDAVKETNFPEGNWTKLVKDGFIKEDEVVIPELAAADNTAEEPAEKNDAATALPAFADISRKDIMTKLTEKGIAFENNMNKQALYDLLKG